MSKGFALEALVEEHSVALVIVSLGSLILGLPLVLNVLWHLKESISNVKYIYHSNSQMNPYRFLQRSPLFCAPGLVKFVPAVARLFCLALPGPFLTMFSQNKGDLCSSFRLFYQLGI